jgi:hypothetical protein
VPQGLLPHWWPQRDAAAGGGHLAGVAGHLGAALPLLVAPPQVPQ